MDEVVTRSETPIQTPVPAEIQEKELAGYVSDRWDNWRQSRQDVERKWLELMTSYFNKIDESRYQGGWKWRSRVGFPVLQKVHDSISAALTNSLVPSEDFFSVFGRTPDDNEQAKSMQRYMAYQYDEMEFKEKFRSFIDQLSMLGTSCAAMYWRTDERIVRQQITQTVDEPIFPSAPFLGKRTKTETKLVPVPVVDYDGPDFQSLSMFDVVVDPLIPEFDKTSLIHRVVVPFDQVTDKDKANNPNGIYTGTDRRKKEELATEDSYSDQTTREVLRMAGFTSIKDTLPENSVELLQMWGDFRIKDRVYKNYVCVVMNRRYVIRFEQNPFWHGRKPYIWGTYKQKIGSPYGIGPLEPVIGLQHLINTFANQKADEVNLLLSGAFKYVDDGTIDPDAIKLFPGAMIPVEDINNIAPLTHSAPVSVGYNEVEFLLRFVEDSTAANQFVVGGSFSGGRKTATEVAATKQGGAERLMEVLRHIEDQVLDSVFTMTYQLNQQFMNQSQLVRVIGPMGATFEQVTPQTVSGNYDFKAIGSSFAILRDLRIQNLTNFLDVVARNPMLLQQVNPRGLVKKIYREFGFTDEDQILMPDIPGMVPGMAGVPGMPGMAQALQGAPSPAGSLAQQPIPIPGAGIPPQ